MAGRLTMPMTKPDVGAAASFLVLNCAAWLAFWVWVSGQAGQSWRKVDYGSGAAE